MREPFAEQAEIGVHDGEVRKRHGGCKGAHAGCHITMRASRAKGRGFLRVWVGSKTDKGQILAPNRFALTAESQIEAR